MTEITSLPCPGYVLKRRIPVVVIGDGSEFVARVIGESIAMAGESIEIAMRDLAGLLVDLLDSLDESDVPLSPRMRRQQSSIRQFIERE